MECPKCKAEIEPDAKECQECGIIIAKFLERKFFIKPQAPEKQQKKQGDSWTRQNSKPGKMNPCKECGHECSVKAKSCPQCGAVLPKPSGCLGCLGLIVLLVCVFLGYDQYYKIVNKKNEPTPAQKEQQRIARIQKDKEDYEKCKLDLQCWGHKHSTSAIIMAEELIEKKAKYQSRWTDGVLEKKFSHFKWWNQREYIVTYVGDKLQFQNGFGAWENMVYECDYDPINKKVLNVRVRPGRI